MLLYSNYKTTLILIIFLIFTFPAYSQSKENPNILFFVVDDMADWVAAMNGHPDVITPSIDRLAERGTIFTNAFATSPICGPSRAAILTGLRPENSNVYTNVGTYIDYVPDVVAFPEYLRNNGYHVMGAGKINHAYTKVVDNNWDEYGPDVGIVGSPFTNEELLTENMDPTIVINRDNLDVTLPINNMSTIDRPHNRWSTFDWGPLNVPDDDFPDGKITNWGIEQLERSYEKPFFLGFGIYKPHLPWYAPKKYFDLYDIDKINLPPTMDGELDDLPQSAKEFAHLPWTAGSHSTVIKNDQWKEAVHAYLATISFIDNLLGRVLDALENSEHADNTMIIFFSDHGFHLGEKETWGKHTPWQPSNRTPFIIVPPKNNDLEDYEPGLASNAMVNLLDIYPTIVDMAGLPKKSGLDGKSIYPLVKNPKLEWDEATVSSVGRGTHSIHTKEWRYIHYFDGTEELYNLKADPNEWKNLANNPKYDEIKRHLSKYIIEDENFKQFIRFRSWKAVKKHDGEMLLFNLYEEPNGISEQNNVFDNYPNVVKTIETYLDFYNFEDRHVIIPY